MKVFSSIGVFPKKSLEAAMDKRLMKDLSDTRMLLPSSCQLYPGSNFLVYKKRFYKDKMGIQHEFERKDLVLRPGDPKTRVIRRPGRTSGDSVSRKSSLLWSLFLYLLKI